MIVRRTLKECDYPVIIKPTQEKESQILNERKNGFIEKRHSPVERNDRLSLDRSGHNQRKRKFSISENQSCNC